MAYRGYKYRLYPNAEQMAYFARCFGATRYCYNYCVREYDAACAAGVQLSGFDIAARLREHLQDVKWMADVDYEIKESAPRRFDNALMKFKRQEANRPRQHKKGECPSVSYITGGVVRVDFKHDLVQLPKIGILRARLHRSFIGDIVSATIKREADGNYYISLTVSSDTPAVPLKPHTEAGTVGVDVGLHHLATLSTGDFKDMPDTSRSESRIQFLKKRLSLEKPGSRRYKRTAIQIARLHHHLANVTKDRHCKIAAELCAGFDTICMETLNVQGMKRGEQGAKTPGDIAFNLRLRRAALASFKDRMERKAADTGTNFVAIDRFEPSTKTCHVCGYVSPKMDLDIREWTCPECGTHHDRDINAAINIRNKGIELLQAQPLKSHAKDKLPLAEGNVKTAKETATGCDLRTGKGTTRYNRPPKAKIAVGSAPPRIFNRHPIAPDHPFRLFNMSELARLVDVPSYAVKSIIDEGRFVEPTPENKETVIKLLTTIKSVSTNLRQMRSDMTHDLCDALGKINKIIRISRILQPKFHFKGTFTNWRAQPFDDYSVILIKEVIVELANKLDVQADKYLLTILPKPVVEPIKKMKPLRRERKTDTLIVASDDPNILTYEDQILNTLNRNFIRKYCHVCQDTINKIVGKGTFFRPECCTRTRMATFVGALYCVAEVLESLDTTAEGKRERLDQLYYINENYLELRRIAMRYIKYDIADFFLYFTRAGKVTPAFYNENYPEIMQVITHDFPILMRECAAYLTSVYQLKDVA